MSSTRATEIRADLAGAQFAPLLGLKPTLILSLGTLALAGGVALFAPLAGLVLAGILLLFLVVSYPAVLLPVYCAAIGLVWTFPSLPIAPLKPSALLLTAGVALALFVRARLPRIHWAHLVFLAFGIWSLLAGEVSGNSEWSRGYSISLIGWAFSLIAIYQLSNGKRGLLALAKSYSLGIALGCLFVIIPFVGGKTNAMIPVAGDVNDFGVLVAAAFFLSLGLARDRGLPRLQRLLFLLATVLCLVVAVGSVSRGTWLAIGVGLVLHFILHREDRLKMIGAAVGLAALALLALPLLSERINQTLQQKEYIADENVDSRILAWRLALRLFSEQPLTGFGIGSIQPQVSANFGSPPGDFVVAFVHNSYIELLYGTGIVGTVLFLVLAVMMLRNTLRVGKILDSALPGGRVAAMLLPAVVATLVASFTVTELTYAPLWLALALGVSANSIVRGNAGKGVDDASPVKPGPTADGPTAESPVGKRRDEMADSS